MAPPDWKVVLTFDEDSEFSSRSLKSETCPCKYCWCEEGSSKWLRKLSVSTFLKYFSVIPPIKLTKPPLWKLVLTFVDGSEFSSRPMNSGSCACQYCWCGKHGIKKLVASDLYAVSKFLSPEAAKSVEQLLERCKSTDNPSCTSLISKETIKTLVKDTNVELTRPVTRALAKLRSQSADLGTESAERPRASGAKNGPSKSKTLSEASSEIPARRQSARISQKKMSYTFVECSDSDSDEET